MEFMTKNDYAYQRLRDEIIEGKIPAGTKLVVNDLAKKYNLSAMPIRHAIARLEQIGLVKRIPHVGCQVNSINLDKYFSYMLLRTEAEAIATFFATYNRKESDIAVLEEILHDMYKAKEEDNSEEYGNANREFHKRVYESSYNQSIIEQVNNLITLTHVAMFNFKVLSTRRESSYKEHVLWLKALKEQNVKHSVSILKYQRCCSNIAMIEHIIESINNEKDIDLFIQDRNIDIPKLQLYLEAFNNILFENLYIKDLINAI